MRLWRYLPCRHPHRDIDHDEHGHMTRVVCKRRCGWAVHLVDCVQAERIKEAREAFDSAPWAVESAELLLAPMVVNNDYA